MNKGSVLRKRTNGRDDQVSTFIRTVPLEDVVGIQADDSGVDITVAHTTIMPLENSSILELWIAAATQNYVGGDSIVIKLYRDDFPGPDTGYSLVETLTTIVTEAVTAGEAVVNTVINDNDAIKSCTHYSIAGTFVVAAGGSLAVTLGKLGALAD